MHITLAGNSITTTHAEIERIVIGTDDTVAQRRFALVETFGRDSGVQVIDGRTMPTIDSDDV